MDENIKEIICTYGVDESIGNYEIGNFWGENYWKKERNDLLVEDCVDHYHKYSGPNGEWVKMDKIFDQAALAAESCAKYKYAPYLLVKIIIKIKLELHIQYTTHVHIGNDKIGMFGLRNAILIEKKLS